MYVQGLLIRKSNRNIPTMTNFRYSVTKLLRARTGGMNDDYGEVVGIANDATEYSVGILEI
jgi:hypothetical protein